MALYPVIVWFDLNQLLGADFDPKSKVLAYATTNADNDTLIDTSTGEIRIGDQAVTINADGTGEFTTWSPGLGYGNPVTWQTSLVVNYPRAGQRDRATRVFGPYTIVETTRVVTNKALTANGATITVSEPHGLRVGDNVAVYDVDATFNTDPTTIVAVPTPTSLSYYVTHADVASTAATGSIGSTYVSLALLEEEQAVPPTYLTTMTALLDTKVTAAQTARTGAETARTGAEAAELSAQALVLSDLGTTDGQTRALIENPASQTAGALAASIADSIQTGETDPQAAVDARVATTGAVYFVRPQVMLVGAGIDYTGATDSTTAIQAIIDAAPQGAWIMVQAGILKFTNLTLDEGKRLIGIGWQFYRDACTTFGDAQYLDDQWFGGTVLRSTATSGIAIEVLDGTRTTGAAVSGFILIGPGSGTSIGIAIGSTTRSVIDPEVDVWVCNFSLGVRTRNVNEGELHIRTRGCTKGLAAENGTNNVAIHGNFQKGVDGASTSSDTLGTTFYSPICQSLTGTGLTIDGTDVAIYNPYHESNAGVMAIDFVGGRRHHLDSPSLNTTPDTVRVQAAATEVRVTGMSPARLADESASTIVDIPRPWITVGGSLGAKGWFSGTVDASGNFTSTAHGLVVGQTVGFTTIPGIGGSFARSTSATYYVESVPDADHFTLSATAGGAAITTGVTAGAFKGLRGTAFKNSFVNSAGRTTKFRRSIDGKHLEIVGSVQGGISNAVIITLPSVEFMPFSAQSFYVLNASQGTACFGTITNTGDFSISGGISTDIRRFSAVIPLDV